MKKSQARLDRGHQSVAPSERRKVKRPRGDKTIRRRYEFTPGPLNTNARAWVVEPIAACEGPNAVANARLVAVAPELLQVCKSILEIEDDSNTLRVAVRRIQVLSQARSIIARVEGVAHA